MSQVNRPTLILASTSKARRALLSAAGVKFACVKPEVDEAGMKSVMAALSVQDLASELAARKSLDVSSRRSGSIVIGADQTLDLGGQGFDKPQDIEAARRQLMQLRAKTHQLHSAICCSRDGEILWQHVSSASLTMRAFSTTELDNYINQATDSLMHSVGSYQIEGPAIQLFERIEGDYFTILGLPLLPLLEFLRKQQVIVQ